jgi:hypothetical protein
MAVTFVTFRSRDLIEAVYYDGSRDGALEVLNAFPYYIQMELDGDNKPTLRIANQAQIVKAHSWLYRNGEHGRIEVRDHEELSKKWEQIGAQAEPPKKKGKGK